MPQYKVGQNHPEMIYGKAVAEDQVITITAKQASTYLLKGIITLVGDNAPAPEVPIQLRMVSISQAGYDALEEPDDNTMYVIPDEDE